MRRKYINKMKNIDSFILERFPENERWPWLDVARGIMIFLMIISSLVSRFDYVSGFYKHAPTGSISIIDIGTATFIFIMGISAYVSFSKRQREKGTMKALVHHLHHYTFIGLLAVVQLVIEMLIGTPKIWWKVWDVLPTLAMVGVWIIPFIIIKDMKWRNTASIAGTVVYCILGYALFITLPIKHNNYILNATHNLFWMNRAGVHGGLFGSAGYALIAVWAYNLTAILYTILVIQKNPLKGLFHWITTGVVLLFVGLIWHFIELNYFLQFEGVYGISKRAVNGPYIFVSLGVNILLCSVIIIAKQNWSQPTGSVMIPLFSLLILLLTSPLKNLVSVIVLGIITVTAYLIFKFIGKRIPRIKSEPVFTAIGRNAIILYFIAYLIGLVYKKTLDIGSDTNFWFTLPLIFIPLYAITLLGVFLHIKKKYLRI
ncbi:MAG: hypothetical protein KBB01_06645 [Candidatus Omnitrophica bacterium]|jgi:predicted acyltransferase|nr:hypothetical protein [Candidatus Omnitrophota bacterium]